MRARGLLATAHAVEPARRVANASHVALSLPCSLRQLFAARPDILTDAGYRLAAIQYQTRQHECGDSIKHDVLPHESDPALVPCL